MPLTCDYRNVKDVNKFDKAMLKDTSEFATNGKVISYGEREMIL